MTSRRRTWHVLTGEFPPRCGGVGDYAAMLSGALALAGDRVHVWTPSDPSEASSRIVAHKLPDVFGPLSCRVLSEGIAADPGILLLQYVPNALGRRGANLAFCRWLLASRRAGADVRVMFHEPYLYFSARRPWRNALALAQRLMARTLMHAATDVYLSSDTWRRYLAPYGDVSKAIALPIPSTLPEPTAMDVAACRTTFGGGPDAPLIAHFGTYGDHVERELRRMLPAVLETCPAARLVLAGARSDRFLDSMPALRGRAIATGWLPPACLSAVLAAADVVIQPYPDGVTTRRTSIMAAMRNGCAIVTTDGALTERVWRRGAVALVQVDQPRAFATACARLLADRTERIAQGSRARTLYHAQFSLERTLAALGVPCVATAAG
jgi:glycosyltransferase involved in cell wall biosynthesis